MFEIFFTNSSVADPDTGSGLRCLFDPWILDGLKVRIRIRDPEFHRNADRIHPKIM